MSDTRLSAVLMHAAEWCVETRVVPTKPGEGVVEVTAKSDAGQCLRMGIPLGWPDNYEDRDMEAAALVVVRGIFLALGERCLDLAHKKVGMS